MLKPKNIEQLPTRMIELYSEAEQDILADMARRISTYDYWIPSADWQYQKLIEMGNVHDEILSTLSALTRKSQSELTTLMTEAGKESLAVDAKIYQAHNLSPPPLASSPAMQATLKAGLTKTAGLFDNLTKTTANTATKQFERALDRAYMQVASGAFDYNTAVRRAVKDLAKQGVQAIAYPSGHVDNLEVAVRRAVVTGVNQTALQLQETLAEEMDSDLVETTAHGGARPDHAKWQGQVFSRSGKHPRYPSLHKATGYGTGAGLGGWNCRHSFFPYFEGDSLTYTPDMLKEYEAETCKYNGTSLTDYEASEQQRSIERNIRRWKRENIAMQSAGLDTTESAGKIKQWQAVEQDFCQQTGRKPQNARSQIAGYNRPNSQQTLAGSALDFMGKPQIFESEKFKIKAYAVDGLQDTLSQTYTADARNTIARIEKIKKDGVVEGVAKTVVAKDLPGFAAYDHSKNILYVNEQISNAEYLSSELHKGYFVAETVEDIIKHEMFHKKHWDFILSKGGDHAIIKKDIEAELRKYVVEQQNYDFGYINRVICQNAYNKFNDEDTLNELIAEVLLQDEKGLCEDSVLLKLVRRCTE